MFLTAFACKPIRKSWSIFEQGKCLDVETLNLASAAGNIVTDVGIFLVPQCVIWGLRMGDWRRKARLVAVFGVGVV